MSLKVCHRIYSFKLQRGYLSWFRNLLLFKSWIYLWALIESNETEKSCFKLSFLVYVPNFFTKIRSLMQQGKKMTGVEQGRQYWGNIKNIYILLQTNNLRKLVQFVCKFHGNACAPRFNGLFVIFFLIEWLYKTNSQRTPDYFFK